MAEIATHSAENPEFARVVELAKLRGREDFAFDLSPTPAESAALARLMGAQAVRKLRFAGRLLRSGDSDWRLEAELGATVVQTCVVTLEPVTTRVDAPVRRTFARDAAPLAVDLVLDGPDDDEIEPLGDRIDLGLVATEALALALPAYPRRADARLGPAASSAPPGAAPLPEAEVRPFAALAALRAKMGGGS